MRRTLFTLILLLAGCRGGSEISPPVTERDHLTVKTTVVRPVESGVQKLEFSGRARASKSTAVGFLRGGKVNTLYFDEGDQVAAGSVLATLDTRQLKARRDELLAQLEEARASYAELEAGPRRYEKRAAQDQVEEIEANLSLVRTKLKRRQDLYSKGAIAQESVDELESQETALTNQLQAAKNQVKDLEAGARPEARAAGRARVEQVQASLDSLEVDLADSVLEAPYGGTVSKRLVDEGAIVSTGQPVFELLTEASLEVELFLPTERVASLRIGDTVKLRAEEQPVTATVLKFLPEVDTETGTRGVLLSLPPGSGLQPGQLVRMAIDSKKMSNGYWLPSTALLPGERGLFVCYTVRPADGETELFEVRKQALEVLTTEGDRTFVRGTPSGAMEVITEGVQRVVPGQKVRVP